MMGHHVTSNRVFPIRTPFRTLDGSVCSAKDALVLSCQKMSLYGLAEMTAKKVFSPGEYNQYNASSVPPRSRFL